MQPGESISFSLLLMDRAVDLLPQIVYAVRLMGESGIGAGRRHNMGRFDLEQVTSGEQIVYSSENGVLLAPDKRNRIQLARPDDSDISWINQHGWTKILQATATTNHENSLIRHHFVGDFRIKIDLLTPLRLKQNNRLGHDLPFHVLVRACLRRISALEDAYGGGEPDIDYRGLVERAAKIGVDRSSLRWQPLYRWSNRQKKKVSLSGLAGSITYCGDLVEFMPVLCYGRQVNIGKQTVFGLGKIRITEEGF